MEWFFCPKKYIIFLQVMILKCFLLIILSKCHGIGPIGAPSWTSHISMASLCSTLHSWSFTKEHYIKLALFIIHKFTSLNGCMWHITSFPMLVHLRLKVKQPLSPYLPLHFEILHILPSISSSCASFYAKCCASSSITSKISSFLMSLIETNNLEIGL
jgi:hypothetical protein